MASLVYQVNIILIKVYDLGNKCVNDLFYPTGVCSQNFYICVNNVATVQVLYPLWIITRLILVKENYLNTELPKQ